MKTLFKKDGNSEDAIGDGSALDAARYEIETGEKVQGRDHVKKLGDVKKALEKLIAGKELTHDPKTGRKFKKKAPKVILELSSKDKKVAKELLNEINKILSKA